MICGYCAIGRLNSAIPPVKVMTIDSTVAKMGRSMKKCEIMANLRWIVASRKTSRRRHARLPATVGSTWPRLHRRSLADLGRGVFVGPGAVPRWTRAAADGAPLCSRSLRHRPQAPPPRKHGDQLGFDCHVRTNLLQPADHDQVVRLQSLS